MKPRTERAYKSRPAERRARERKCLRHEYRDTRLGDIRCRLCGKTTTQQRVDAAHKLAEYRRRQRSAADVRSIEQIIADCLANAKH